MGGKYGKRRQRQTDRDSREALAELERVERWWPDTALPTEQSTETAHDGDWQISQRTVRYAGTNTLIEFAVTYSVLTGGETWREILCIDTCNHDSIHRHYNGDHGTHEPIEFISDQDVIQNQYWEAVGEAYALAYGEG